MSQMKHISSFKAGHEKVIVWIIEQLTPLGMDVKSSFDLKAARAAHFECACPHHGTELCDCQIIVLLVYPGQDGTPISMIVHSQDGSSHVTISDIPDGGEGGQFVSKIIHALGHQNISSII